MILFLLSLASAEPLMMRVEKGQTAPFDGRLFNDEAVASILADSESVIQQCEIRKDLEWKTKWLSLQYKYDILEAELRCFKIQAQLKYRCHKRRRDKVLRKQAANRSLWMFIGGLPLALVLL